MQNMLLEVKSVRRCDNGHTCNLIANGRKVAFIAPGIFEWTNYSKKVDVLTWFAARAGSKAKQLQPTELKDGWESEIPDHRLEDAKHEATETALHQWVILHFKAYEITQRCKFTVMSLGSKGEILDWGISPDSLHPTRLGDNWESQLSGCDSGSGKAKGSGYSRSRSSSSTLLNKLSMPEIVRLLEQKLKPTPRRKRAKV